MSNPNRIIANSRRKLLRLKSIGVQSRKEAEEIASAQRAPGVIVKISRFRIGSRSERHYAYQVHVYQKQGYSPFDDSREHHESR